MTWQIHVFFIAYFLPSFFFRSFIWLFRCGIGCCFLSFFFCFCWDKFYVCVVWFLHSEIWPQTAVTWGFGSRLWWCFTSLFHRHNKSCRTAVDTCCKSLCFISLCAGFSLVLNTTAVEICFSVIYFIFQRYSYG